MGKASALLVALWLVALPAAAAHPNNITGSADLVMIDLERRAVSGTIDLSPHLAPRGLQVDAEGMLYAGCDLSRTLLVIDPRTRSIEAASDTDGTGIETLSYY